MIIRRRRRSRSASGTPTKSWEMVRARGHHDEVLNLVGAQGLGSFLICAQSEATWEMVRARGHHDQVLNLVGACEFRA